MLVVPIPTICDVVWIPVIDVVNAPAPPPPPPWILISTVVPLTANVLPVPTKLSWVIPAPIWTPPDWIPTWDGPWNAVSVTTPDDIIPFLAVIKPTESTFLTSSYVKVPPIDKFPDTV